MNITLRKPVIAAASALLMAYSSNIAGAFPSRGGSCTDCHGNPGGALTVSPNPFDTQVSQTKLLTFTITSLGGSSETAISVQGLENPALNASIVPGGDTWTYRTNATYGNSYVSNSITSTGPYTLNLAIGGLATPGTYPIVVMYAGDGELGTEYDPGFTIRVAAAGLAGDYNNNGIVDAADYVLWRKTLGQTGVGLPADGNGNSQIDAGDYGIWRTNFGHTAASGMDARLNVAVPEPAAAAMLLVVLLVIRRRTKSPG